MSIAYLPPSEVRGDGRGDGRGDRIPPHDLLAEQSAIGGMLLSKDAAAEVLQAVKGADFYIPKHELVFEAVLSLYSRGEPTDVIAVTDELTKQGELARAGGAEYLHELTSIVPTAANAGYYAEIVAEKAMLRRLVEAGTRIVQIGYAAEGEVTDLINDAQAAIYAVNGDRHSDDFAPLSVAVTEALDEIGRNGTKPGVPTGFAELDRLTNGLQPGQLVVLAARPGIGKSTLGLDIARSAAIRHRMPAIIFSLEMSKSELAMRLLSAEAQVYLNKLRSGQLVQDDWDMIAKVQGRINEAPLFLDDSPNMTLVEIRAKARRLKQRAGLKLIVVDYLQLMTSGKRVESRQQEVAEFSRALKLLAKELEVPVIAISQLNRKSEDRSDKKPLLSDLRESGAIEQDADMVILLHRDPLDRDGPTAGEADFIVAKHRNGPTDELKAIFQGGFSRFADLPANR